VPTMAVVYRPEHIEVLDSSARLNYAAMQTEEPPTATKTSALAS
jgi:hypothetical protein